MLSSPTVSEVVERLRRFTARMGMPECAVDGTLGSLTLSYWTPRLDAPITIVREVHQGTPQLTEMSETIELLDQVERGELDLRTAGTKLRGLREAPSHTLRYPMVASVISVTGWVVFLGGLQFWTILIAAVASTIAVPIRTLVLRAQLPTLVGTAVAATVLAVVPNLAAAAGLSLEVGPAVVGGLFMYLPGLAVVASLIDGLQNMPISALARSLSAVLTATALALGMLAGNALGAGLGLDYQPDATSVPWPLSTAGAVIGMLGVSMSWGAPARALPPTLMMGAAGWILVALVTQQGSFSAWAPSALAATSVGLLGILAAVRQRSSPSLFMGVAIMPLVPGFTLYQAMLALAQGQQGAAELLGQVALTSVSIAVGVALGFALGRNAIKGRREILRRLPARR